MTIGSLFSGIGGLERGLEMCGLGPVIWQAESDPCARAVLAKHWPTVRRYEDVREIDETAARVALVCGGFPCQDISNAGKRAGIDGAQSGLWSEFARIVRVLRPRFVFVENVGALTARGLDRVLGDLAAFGFNAEWESMGACQAGRPQTRERVFILAYAHPIAGSERLCPRPTERTLPRGTDREMSEDVRLESDRELQRMADGLPREVDRLRLLGNAVVPAQAALAWQTLTARAGAAS